MMTATRCSLLLLLFLALIPFSRVHAQDIGYGATVSGRLDDGTPRAVYSFDGLRGDVITISLTVKSGSLDPVLTLIDSGGEIVALRDDAIASGGERDLRLESIRIPKSDRYYLIAGRFGDRLGSTSGDYSLVIERIGVSSSSGSALRYGDSVYNTITDMNPQVYYSFRAQRGDVVSVRMLRATGDLDAALQVLNSRAEVVGENDDTPGSLDAAISGLIIQEDGTYVIVASRFGQAAGRSRGAFVLTLEEGANSGLGNRVDFPLPVLPGTPVRDTISSTFPERFYSFEGRRDDIVTIRMSRVSGALDAFLVLLGTDRRELTSDDDSGGGQNALIRSYILPADGAYTVIATRYQRAQGESIGDFQLDVQVEGSAFQGVPPNAQRIGYGSSATGAISDTMPQVLYTFLGNQGDVISVAMNRADGDLDPRLTLLDREQRVLTSDDDSGGGQNARIESYTLPYSGVYYIQASRYTGEANSARTRGAFSLVLTQQGGE